MISGKHLTYKIYNVYALLLLNFALLLVKKTYTIQIITGFFDIDLLFWLAIDVKCMWVLPLVSLILIQKFNKVHQYLAVTF